MTDTKPAPKPIRSGDDVRFTGAGGYAKDRANAKAELTVGNIYRVDGVWAGQFYTSLSLFGAKGRFNSVLFERVEGRPVPPHGSGGGGDNLRYMRRG